MPREHAVAVVGTGAARGRRRRTATTATRAAAGILGTFVIGSPSSASISRTHDQSCLAAQEARGRCSGPRRPRSSSATSEGSTRSASSQTLIGKTCGSSSVQPTIATVSRARAATNATTTSVPSGTSRRPAAAASHTPSANATSRPVVHWFRCSRRNWFSGRRRAMSTRRAWTRNGSAHDSAGFASRHVFGER